MAELGTVTPMAVDAPAVTEQKKRIAGETETGCSERERFLLELEFVQGLANPHYLNWLAQNKYLSDPAFIKYIDYLQYWREPKYCKYIIYPQSLYFLDLLQSENFRTAVASPSVREMIHRQQLFFWKHFRANRVKEEMEEQEGQPAAENGPGGAAALAQPLENGTI